MATKKSNQNECSQCISRCGPLGWYLSPITDKISHSVGTTLFHLFNFVLSLFVCLFIGILMGVSIGLMVIVVGFILYWITCEMSVGLARIDLIMTWFMTDNENELNNVKLAIDDKLLECPCFNKDLTLKNRIKSLICSFDMYKIIIYQIFIKIFMSVLTSWIFIVDIYLFVLIFSPIVFAIYPNVFTKHYVCPFGGSSCDKNGCQCVFWAIENFGHSLLLGILCLLLLPISLRISQWFAKANRSVTYLFISKFYYTRPNYNGMNFAQNSNHSENDSSNNNHTSIPMATLQVTNDEKHENEDENDAQEQQGQATEQGEEGVNRPLSLDVVENEGEKNTTAPVSAVYVASAHKPYANDV